MVGLNPDPPFDLEEALVACLRVGKLKLPPYPAVALRLSAIARKDDYSIAEIVAAISADPVTAAGVLRCANSAFFSRGAKITTLPQAVGWLGAQEIVRISLASALAATTTSAGGLQALKRQAWHGSVASALICQELARLRVLNIEEAFLCGLLHDFGWVVGISLLEELLAQRPEVPAQDAAHLSAMLSRLHVEIGLVIAARWNLPAVFSDVFSLHHDATPGQGAHGSVVEVVAASDQVVALLAHHSSVSAEELKRVSALTRPEREAIAAILPDIPAVIASFEGTPPKAAPSKLVEPTPLPDGFRPLSAPVKIVQPAARGDYSVVGIASQSFRMEGRWPLTLNQLVECELAVEPAPLRLWAKVVRCSPQGDGFGLEVKPFALNGAALKQWNSLFRAQSPV